MTSIIWRFAFVFCNLLRRQRIPGSQLLPFGTLKLLLAYLRTGVISKEWLSCFSLFCRTPPVFCHSADTTVWSLDAVPPLTASFLSPALEVADLPASFLLSHWSWHPLSCPGYFSISKRLSWVCLLIYLFGSVSIVLTLYSNFLNNHFARAALIILSANRIMYFMFASLSTDGFFSSFWVIGLDFFYMPNKFCLEFRDCVNFPVGSKVT